MAAPAGSILAEIEVLKGQIESLGDASATAKLKDQLAVVSTKVSAELGAAAIKPGREKIEVMSAEVVDSNPYSRLLALQRMGIVEEYQKIREKTVAVVGMGGVGSVAAEMLTRCGVGRLLMYDYDRVELANMNRLFFRPEHAGMTKTDAAAKTLAEINPDVDFESFTGNITSVEGFDKFIASLTDDGGKKSRVDLVLSCVDNYEARMTINQACLELGQTWMESGVSEDAVSGHIQLLVPGETACFACVPPLVVASGIDEKTLKREGVCAASLPTTMGLVAAMLVQNSLKYLLNFGTVSAYVGYSALKDFFPSMEIKANPGCTNGVCCRRQTEWHTKYNSPGAVAARAAEKAAAEAAAATEAAKPLHEENDWGISCMPDDAGDEQSAGEGGAGDQQQLAEGLSFGMPTEQVDASELKDNLVESTDNSVDDLAAQLAALTGGGK